MGSSGYSSDEMAARVSYRKATSTPVFKHDADVKAGRAYGVAPTMNPLNVTRESRDSDEHPVSVPIAVIMDTTGSMADVPPILEAALSKLMGVFLDDKASGKRYLGDGYPAILIGAVDDYNAMGGDGALQVGQFESGIEIDNDLEKIWLTKRGGGTYEESYELALYFMARHTVHDNLEKRGRKGYLFIIGDEHPYPSVSPTQVLGVIGDTIQAPIAVSDIVAEAQKMYHVFFVIPNMTQHYDDVSLFDSWVKLVGQQNTLRLEDPTKVCELIAGAVALCEENVGLDDMLADGTIDPSIRTALVPLSKVGGGLAKVSADSLPATTGLGDASDVERV